MSNIETLRRCGGSHSLDQNSWKLIDFYLSPFLEVTSGWIVSSGVSHERWTRIMPERRASCNIVQGCIKLGRSDRNLQIFRHLGPMQSGLFHPQRDFLVCLKPPL